MDKDVRIFRLHQIRTVGGKGGQPQRIVGYAAVYNQLSEDLGGFREIIKPGFFEEALRGDIVSLWNHNADKPLGRTKNGTLVLTDDGMGLGMKVELPDTSWGRDATISVARGDVSQASFGFRVRKGGDSWEKRADGQVIRTLLRGGCERLYDVSPVTFPAYPQTSVAVRSMAEKIKQRTSTGQTAGGNGPGARKATGQARIARLRRKLDLITKT